MVENSDTVRADGGGQTAVDATGQNATEGPADPDTLRARLAVLEEENRRLRAEYSRARRSQYRRTAVGLAALGIVALAGTVVAPGARTVLFALAGTGLFGALLTWTLTPEEFVAASVGEQITAAYAADRDSLCTELGLQDDRIYTPSQESAKLFVPQRPDYELPDTFDSLLVVPEDPAARGVAFTPTGAPLYRAFLETRTGESVDDPSFVATQLADAVVEEFELAHSATVSEDRDGDGVAVSVEGATFGDIGQTDHPVLSTIATGLAVESGRPVKASVSNDEGDTAILEFRFSEE